MKHSNETVMAELPIRSVFEGATAADTRWQCDGCNAYFGSSQGLGSHKNSCTLLRDQLMQSVQGTGPIFAAFKNGPPGSSKDTSKQSTLMGGTVQEIPINKAAILLNNDDGMPELTKRDGRKSNKGRAKRGKYTNEEKAELIHKWEMYHNDTGKKVSDFVKEYGLDKKFNTLLSKGKGQWRHPDQMEKIMKAAADESKKKLLRAGNVTLDRPMWPSMEFELENDIRARRNRGARVSTNFIKTRAKQLMKKHYPENTDFKASEGWMLHFRKRKKIKFCRRQNKKRLNIEEKRDNVSFC